MRHGTGAAAHADAGAAERLFDNTTDPFTFVVRGLPAPQGSKSFKGFTREGRAILTESSERVRPWRQDVVAAAYDAKEATPGFRAYTGPVHLVVEFFMPRPKNDPKTRRTIPSKVPDLSKLIRSTEDAMKTAGVWTDDALVTDLTTRKRYALLAPELGHAWELPGSGAVITVIPIDPDSTWSDEPLAHTIPQRVTTLPEQIGVHAVYTDLFVVDDDPRGTFTVPADATDAKAIKVVERATSELARGGVVTLVVEEGRSRLASYPGKPLSPLQAAVLEYLAAAGERADSALMLPATVVW